MASRLDATRRHVVDDHGRAYRIVAETELGLEPKGRSATPPELAATKHAGYVTPQQWARHKAGLEIFAPATHGVSKTERTARRQADQAAIRAAAAAQPKRQAKACPSIAAYWRGCRCAGCRSAQSEYTRERLKDRRARATASGDSQAA
jgi:hypothetical protein